MTVVTVVIVTYLTKNNLTHLTAEAMFEGQRFAILAMFIKKKVMYLIHLVVNPIALRLEGHSE